GRANGRRRSLSSDRRVPRVVAGDAVVAWRRSQPSSLDAAGCIRDPGGGAPMGDRHARPLLDDPYRHGARRTACRQGPLPLGTHPNYLIVALEIPLLPYAFGAPGLAALFGCVNLLLLAYRLWVEEHALAPRRRAASGPREA